MAGYLIKDTTREEREQIVAESLGYMEANCDGCSSGLAEMYQAYIDGEKELREKILPDVRIVSIKFRNLQKLFL